MLLSVLKPTSGRITYFGTPLDRGCTDVLKPVGYASGYSRLPPRLTVEENLDVFARLCGLARDDRRARISALLASFGVLNLRRRLMLGLSAGETTRVLLAKAFLARPSVVLLDEPTASLDSDIPPRSAGSCGAGAMTRGSPWSTRRTTWVRSPTSATA
jgi:ABC-2 type transport system ATP-binding protein